MVKVYQVNYTTLSNNLYSMGGYISKGREKIFGSKEKAEEFQKEIDDALFILDLGNLIGFSQLKEVELE